MTRNMGTADRLLRAALGIALLAFALFGGTSAILTVIAAIIGVVMLGTAAISHCPLYTVIGLKTCRDS